MPGWLETEHAALGPKSPNFQDRLSHSEICISVRVCVHEHVCMHECVWNLSVAHNKSLRVCFVCFPEHPGLLESGSFTRQEL